MESRENDFDLMLEEEEFFDIEEFINSSDEIDINTEYTIHNPSGDTYHVSYDFVADNNSFSLSYFEHHYTKFWGRSIPAIQYLTLKKKFIKKHYGYIDVSIDEEDECHPTLNFSLTCNKDEISKTILLLEKLHKDFNERCKVLENNINELILNFKV